jgi:hypothetical protein
MGGCKMKDETKKAIEDLGVIKTIINKTRCDMVEISSLFILLGIIRLLSNITNNVIIRIYVTRFYEKISKSEYQIIDISVSLLWLLISAFVLMYYYQIVKKKNNLISKAIIQFWCITSVIIPILLKATSISMNSGRTNSIISNSESIKFYLNIYYLNQNFSFVIMILSILLVGILLFKKSILILSAVLSTAYFISEIIGFVNGSIYTNPHIPAFWAITYLLVDYLGVLFLGILLKLDGRKKVNGVE